MKEQNKERVLRAVGDWNSLDNYDEDPIGRIWVLWKPAQVSVTWLSKSMQFIHCEVCCLSTQARFLVTVVYAANAASLRVGL